MKRNPKIIVVGGNAAGPSAAAKAKRTNPDAEVIMFEAGPYISTGTCELPYLLGNVIDDYKKLVFFSPDEFFEEKNVKAYTNHLVESIDRKEKRIKVKNLSDESVYNYEYDKLILATGAIAKKINGSPIESENLFNLKTIADYLKISKYLESNRVKKAVIIGSGFIGIEAAENFLKLGIDVAFIEKSSLPLPFAEPETSNLIKDILDRKKVEFIGNFSNLKFNTRNKRVSSINIDGRLIDTDLVISAIGFAPNNRLAIASGLSIGEYEGVKVNNKLQTSDMNIYAAGDCIEVINRVTKKPDYIPLATLAHDQGHIAGANAAGENDQYQSVVKNAAVKIFDNVLTMVGLSSKEAGKHSITFDSVNSVAPNLVKVMPGSEQTFGKLLYERGAKKIIGAEFFGQSEVIGYADLISSLILQNANVEILARINFNYTPPNSPFINNLSILGRKVMKK